MDKNKKMKKNRTQVINELIEVPSKVYNSCDTHDWSNHLRDAKILHIKGELRDDLKQGVKFPDAVDIFNKYKK